MDELKKTNEMTVKELTEELVLGKNPNKKDRRQLKLKKRPLKHLENYLKAYRSLYK